MCLGIPGKVIEINGNYGKVDFGGSFRYVNLSLVEAKVGDYVIVHAGYAIEIVDEEEAKKTIEIWESMIEKEQ